MMTTNLIFDVVCVLVCICSCSRTARRFFPPFSLFLYVCVWLVVFGCVSVYVCVHALVYGGGTTRAAAALVYAVLSLYTCVCVCVCVNSGRGEAEGGGGKKAGGRGDATE